MVLLDILQRDLLDSDLRPEAECYQPAVLVLVLYLITAAGMLRSSSALVFVVWLTDGGRESQGALLAVDVELRTRDTG